MTDRLEFKSNKRASTLRIWTTLVAVVFITVFLYAFGDHQQYNFKEYE
jgi:hypothetical protein